MLPVCRGVAIRRYSGGRPKIRAKRQPKVDRPFRHKYYQGKDAAIIVLSVRVFGAIAMWHGPAVKAFPDLPCGEIMFPSGAWLRNKGGISGAMVLMTDTVKLNFGFKGRRNLDRFIELGGKDLFWLSIAGISLGISAALTGGRAFGPGRQFFGIIFPQPWIQKCAFAL